MSTDHEDPRVVKHRQIIAAYEYAVRTTEMWGIDIIKTLFLLNAAGLAGVFTLVQVKEIPRESLPFFSFSIGIVLTVASLTFGRYMHSAAANGWLQGANSYAASFYDEDAKLPNTRTVECFEFAQTSAAYASAGACLWAGYTLYGLFG